MTEYSAAKTGKYSRIFPVFKTARVAKKIWRIVKTLASIWGRKYARIFGLGHYLFLAAHSFSRATHSENCSLLGTDNVHGQISLHIFAPNGGYCWYIDKGRFQVIPQNFYCNYAKNYLSCNSVYPYSRMVSYDLFLFMLKIETSTGGTNSMPFLVFRRDHLRSTSRNICGSGSFAVQFGDHFGPGDHLRRCTVLQA